MPLHDHFRPPLSDTHSWEAIHCDWASTIVRRLNEIHLPEVYFAGQQIRIGSEIDDGTLQLRNSFETEGDVAVLSHDFQFINTDTFEIQIHHRAFARKLAGAIELVSPAHKDRSSHRMAFITKCAGYLARGISVVVIDAVTECHANLHAELLNLMRLPDALFWESPTSLSAIAYRVVRIV